MATFVRVNCSKVFPLQLIAANSYMAILVRGVSSSKVLPPLQHVASHCYMAILVRGLIPQKSSHCSALLHDNYSQGGNSSKVPPLQPIPAHSYTVILVRVVIPQKSSHCSPLQPAFTWQFESGGNSSKVLPLQPNSYKIYPSEKNYPPTLTSIYPHRQTTPPPSYNKMGGF